MSFGGSPRMSCLALERATPKPEPPSPTRKPSVPRTSRGSRIDRARPGMSPTPFPTTPDQNKKGAQPRVPGTESPRGVIPSPPRVITPSPSHASSHDGHHHAAAALQRSTSAASSREHSAGHQTASLKDRSSTPPAAPFACHRASDAAAFTPAYRCRTAAHGAVLANGPHRLHGGKKKPLPSAPAAAAQPVLQAFGGAATPTVPRERPAPARPATSPMRSSRPSSALSATPPKKVATARAGAIKPLVARVRSGSAVAQKQAAAALSSLANNADTACRKPRLCRKGRRRTPAERVGADTLERIGSALRFGDLQSLGRCARVCRAWRVAFGVEGLLGKLPQRVAARI